MPSLTIGNRVPTEFFLTSGRGEWPTHPTLLGKAERLALAEEDPFETGSYDKALRDAGIGNANIMTYSSVIPTKARQISRTKGVRKLVWGQVLESIIARADGKRGDTIAAAVMLTNVSYKGRHLGGFATEYSGRATRREAITTLTRATKGMLRRRGYGALPARDDLLGKTWKTSEGFHVTPGAALIYDSIRVKSDTGTVLAAVCFTAFDVEVLRRARTKRRRPRKPRTGRRQRRHRRTHRSRRRRRSRRGR